MNNLDAERAVVSAILVKPAVIDDVIEILEPSDFTDMQYGLIYGTLRAIDAKDIDIITLAEKLAQKGILVVFFQMLRLKQNLTKLLKRLFAAR